MRVKAPADETVMRIVQIKSSDLSQSYRKFNL